jgi:hypothetical protein
VPRAELRATLARILSLLREPQRTESIPLPTALGQ